MSQMWPAQRGCDGQFYPAGNLYEYPGPAASEPAGLPSWVLDRLSRLEQKVEALEATGQRVTVMESQMHALHRAVGRPEGRPSAADMNRIVEQKVSQLQQALDHHVSQAIWQQATNAFTQLKQQADKLQRRIEVSFVALDRKVEQIVEQRVSALGGTQGTDTAGQQNPTPLGHNNSLPQIPPSQQSTPTHPQSQTQTLRRMNPPDTPAAGWSSTRVGFGRNGRRANSPGVSGGGLFRRFSQSLRRGLLPIASAGAAYAGAAMPFTQAAAEE